MGCVAHAGCSTAQNPRVTNSWAFATRVILPLPARPPREPRLLHAHHRTTRISCVCMHVLYSGVGAFGCYSVRLTALRGWPPCSMEVVQPFSGAARGCSPPNRAARERVLWLGLEEEEGKKQEGKESMHPSHPRALVCQSIRYSILYYGVSRHDSRYVLDDSILGHLGHGMCDATISVLQLARLSGVGS